MNRFVRAAFTSLWVSRAEKARRSFRRSRGGGGGWEEEEEEGRASEEGGAVSASAAGDALGSDGYTTGAGRRRGGLEGPLREDGSAVGVVALVGFRGVEEEEEVEGTEDEDDATTGARKSTGMRRACFAKAER